MAALKAFAFLAVCDPRFSFGKGTASSDRPDRARPGQTGPDRARPDQTGPDRTKQFAGESIIGDVL
jgi:hypothetical protein